MSVYRYVRRSLSAFTLTEIMIVIAIISVIVLIGTVNYTHARARGQYTACITNVKNIGTACAMYATDNSSHYPTASAYGSTGGPLCPSYIHNIPNCPSAGYATYAASNAYSAATNPDAYTICCIGSNHTMTGVTANFPQYNSAAGLVEH